MNLEVNQKIKSLKKGDIMILKLSNTTIIGHYIGLEEEYLFYQHIHNDDILDLSYDGQQNQLLLSEIITIN